MELTIELANKYIEITEKKVSSGRLIIHQYVRGKMPEGAFLNGIVVNTNAVADKIKELLKEKQIRSKFAVLCVSGMDVIRKDISVPKGSEKHVRGMLENELHKTDILKKGYLFDYIPDESEGEKGLSNYQIYMLPEDLIGNYQTTFKRAGLRLVRVVPVVRGMEVLARLNGLRKRRELTILASVEATHINLLMTGEGIKNIHRMIEVKEEDTIEDNVFIVSAVRQIQDTTTPEHRVMESLIENISKLVQFGSQTYKGREIGQIQIYGEMAEKKEFLEELEQKSGIPVQRCEAISNRVIFKNNSLERDFWGYNGLCMTVIKTKGWEKELSFVNIPGSAGYVSAKDWMPTFIGVGCILILSLTYCFTVFSNSRKENSIESLRREIEEIETQEQYLQKAELEQHLAELATYNENCKICIELIENKERMKPELFSEVDKLVPTNVTIQSYGYENNTVIFKCISGYQEGPADFAKIVTDTNLFESVKYTGFQAYQDIDGATYYNFQLECKE